MNIFKTTKMLLLFRNHSLTHTLLLKNSSEKQAFVKIIQYVEKQVMSNRL